MAGRAVFLELHFASCWRSAFLLVNLDAIANECCECLIFVGEVSKERAFDGELRQAEMFVQKRLDRGGAQ